MYEATSLHLDKPRFRGVSHEIAAFVFPILGVTVVFLAQTTSVRLAALVYTVGVTAMYATSACYHRGHWSEGHTTASASTRPFDDHDCYRSHLHPARGRCARRSQRHHPPRHRLVARSRRRHRPDVVVTRTAMAGRGPLHSNRLDGTRVRRRHCGANSASLRSRCSCSAASPIRSAPSCTRTRPDPAPAVFGFHEVFHALVIAAGLIFYAAIVRVVVTA